MKSYNYKRYMGLEAHRLMPNNSVDIGHNMVATYITQLVPICGI